MNITYMNSSTQNNYATGGSGYHSNQPSLNPFYFPPHPSASQPTILSTRPSSSSFQNNLGASIATTSANSQVQMLPPAPPSFEYLLLCTFGCNSQSSSATNNLVATSSIEEEQDKISSSNSLTQQGQEQIISDLQFGVYCVKDRKVIKDVYYDFAPKLTAEESSNSSSENNNNNTKKQEEQASQQLTQAFNSCIELVEKEVVSKNAKFVLILDGGSTSSQFEKFIEASKVNTAGYFESYHSIQKECQEAFCLKSANYSTLSSILKYFSLRDNLDPLPTKNSFKQMTKLISLLLAADHKFSSAPLRNPKLAQTPLFSTNSRNATTNQSTPQLMKGNSFISSSNPNNPALSLTQIPNILIPPHSANQGLTLPHPQANQIHPLPAVPPIPVSGQTSQVGNIYFQGTYFPQNVPANMSQNPSQIGNIAQSGLLHPPFAPYYSHQIVPNNNIRKNGLVDSGTASSQGSFGGTRQLSNSSYQINKTGDLNMDNSFDRERRGLNSSNNRDIAPFNQQTAGHTMNSTFSSISQNQRLRNPGSYNASNQSNNQPPLISHNSSNNNNTKQSTGNNSSSTNNNPSTQTSVPASSVSQNLEKDKQSQSTQNTNNNKSRSREKSKGSKYRDRDRDREHRKSKERYNQSNRLRSSSRRRSESNQSDRRRRKSSYEENTNRSPSSSLRRTPTDSQQLPNKSSQGGYNKYQSGSQILQNPGQMQLRIQKNRNVDTSGDHAKSRSSSKSSDRSSSSSRSDNSSGRSSHSKSYPNRYQYSRHRKSRSISGERRNNSPSPVSKRQASPSRISKAHSSSKRIIESPIINPTKSNTTGGTAVAATTTSAITSTATSNNQYSRFEGGSTSSQFGQNNNTSTTNGTQNFDSTRERDRHNSIRKSSRSPLPQSKQYFWIKLKEIPCSSTRNEILQFARHYSGIKVSQDNLYMIADKSNRFSGEAYIKLDRERDQLEMLMLNNREMHGRTVSANKSSYDSFNRKKTISSPSSSPPSHSGQQVSSSKNQSSLGQYSHGSNEGANNNSSNNPSSFYGGQDAISSGSQQQQNQQSSQKYSTFNDREYNNHSFRKDQNSTSNTGSNNNNNGSGQKNSQRSRSTSRSNRSNSSDTQKQSVDYKSKRTLSQFGILRIRGLPYSCSVKEIVDFFKDFELVPDGVKRVFNHQEQKLTGESFIFLKNKDQVREAKHKLHGEKIFQRYIEVFPSDPNEFLDYHISKILPQSISSKNNRNRFPMPSGNPGTSGSMNSNSSNSNAYNNAPRKSYNGSSNSNSTSNMQRYTNDRNQYFEKNSYNNSHQNDSKYRTKRYYDRNSRCDSSEHDY